MNNIDGIQQCQIFGSVMYSSFAKCHHWWKLSKSTRELSSYYLLQYNENVKIESLIKRRHIKKSSRIQNQHT